MKSYAAKLSFLMITCCMMSFLLSIAWKSHAQTIDWSTTIASILYDHCTNCHHEGAIAPFPLMTYEDAATWSTGIATQVNAGIMPPWPPDPDYNHLMNENVLSTVEIDAINDWVNNDMPSGDLNLAPAPPVYNGSSLMVDPDETVLLPVFEMPNIENVYWRFVNQNNSPETRYINAMEFVGGNNSIIHHVTVGLDATGLAWQDDQNYPGPGCPRDFGVNPGVSVFMSQSEGRVISLPQHLGFEVPAGNDYVTDMHYYASAVGQVDSSRFNLKYIDTTLARAVKTEKILYSKPPSLLDGPLEIAANTVKTFHLQSEVFAEDKSLIGLGPHSHQICTSWEIYMVIPTGDTIPLIKIPKWVFTWQGSYLLTKVLKIPAGSQIFGTVTYDNTANNPNNPSNPPQTVYGNGSMLGEMAQAHCWMMDYQAGDEDIILDSAFYGTSTGISNIAQQIEINLFPNPATEHITIVCKGLKESFATFTVYSQLGQLLWQQIENVSGVEKTMSVDCTRFPTGIYYLTVQTETGIDRKKFVVLK